MRSHVGLITILWIVGFSDAQDFELKDITKEARVVFQHQNGQQGKFWLPEIIGAGVGVLDFNADGLLDLWLVQGGSLNGTTSVSDQLYRNVSSGSSMRFENVTKEYRVNATQYGMGIATGDYDNDGDLDVFLANFGSNQLFENRGDRFVDVTEQAGVGDSSWSVSATFFDFDGDANLDLYVANYVDFGLAKHKNCLGISTIPDYCTPNAYEPQADQLLRNKGDGTFDDVSFATGIALQRANGMGVVAADFNQDGRPDIYVANDANPNIYWLQTKDGKFEDHAKEAGIAVNNDGKAEASMGLDAADIDQDCDLDVFMTNLTGETNTLFVNSGKGWFRDSTRAKGLAASSFAFTGFGARWLDIDNDSDLDILSVNGTVSNQAQASDGNQDGLFSQPNQLWLDHKGNYTLACKGGFCHTSEVSRGLAIGDLDNDGDLDFVVTNNNGPARIYANDSMVSNWVGFRLGQSIRPKLGTKLSLVGSTCRGAVFRTDGSYASASDYRVVFGLGSEEKPISVSLEHPTGLKIEYRNMAINQYHTLEASQ